MARPCKPTEVLELTGAFLDNPARRRLPGPKSELPIGEPPGYLAPDEAAAWREFVGNAPAGVLTGGDRWILEVAARLMARSRWQGLTTAETGHLRACLSELRASPASRGWAQPTGSAAAPVSSPWDVPGQARN